LSPTTPGSTFAAGTTTLSKNSPDVTDARRLNLCSISGAENPGVPVSTMKPRMPSSVIAQQTQRSAIAPFVIHIFEPLITQSPPARRFACVFMFAGSEPPCGSVSPKQPINSPVAIRGRYACFCSSLPYAQIGYMHSDDCTETKLRMPLSPRSSSWQIRPYDTAFMPAQP
jgi:hypothetical protein